MDNLLRKLLFILLLFSANSATAEPDFKISPSFGVASVSNIGGYKHTSYMRIDGIFHLSPQLGFNLFYVNYDDFETDGNSGVTPVSLSLNGYGVGVTGLWPLNPQVQPFVRVDYFSWDSEAHSLGKTVGRDSDFSTGLSLGVQFPIDNFGKRFTGLKVEVLRYNDVSGADIDQYSFAAIFEF